VQLVFAPTGPTGARTATFTVTGGVGVSASATLLAAADAAPPPVLSFEPSTEDFGAALIGTTGQSRTFTVTNSGGSPTTVLSFSFGGANPTNFQVSSPGSPCIGAVLAPGDSCDVNVVFMPLGAAGARSATFTVSGGVGVTVTATLFGTANNLSPVGFTP
jgi:hypothetical protein